MHALKAFMTFIIYFNENCTKMVCDVLLITGKLDVNLPNFVPLASSMLLLESCPKTSFLKLGSAGAGP